MSSLTQQSVADFLAPRVTLTGFASPDQFDDAPGGHHPGDILHGAATVVVYGIAVPRGILHSPQRSLYALHRSYHSVYPLLDEISLSLANHLEQAGELAVPAPSYAPMVFHEAEPWGVLSLKHSAVKAGLGAFGHNQLVHHPDYGTMLRFGAVVTTADLGTSPTMDYEPCPEGCTLCMDACPSESIGEDGFMKMKCLGHTIKHAIYPLALNSPDAVRHIERVVNTAGYNYWLKCHECLTVCPSNQGRFAAGQDNN
ncbi:MAG: hypothetical protein ACLFOY_11045 [Desulfatibacillaceae bacterium]